MTARPSQAGWCISVSDAAHHMHPCNSAILDFLDHAMMARLSDAACGLASAELTSSHSKDSAVLASAWGL